MIPKQKAGCKKGLNSEQESPNFIHNGLKGIVLPTRLQAPHRYPKLIITESGL